MKVEFATKDISEFSTGNFYVANNGPFDIPNGAEEAFLSAKATVPDGNEGKTKVIKIFQPVGRAAQEQRIDQLEDRYPDNFPHADKLAEAGYSHADAQALTLDELIALPGIGKASANAIIAFQTGDK